MASLRRRKSWTHAQKRRVRENSCCGDSSSLHVSTWPVKQCLQVKEGPTKRRPKSGIVPTYLLNSSSESNGKSKETSYKMPEPRRRAQLAAIVGPVSTLLAIATRFDE